MDIHMPCLPYFSPSLSECRIPRQWTAIHGRSPVDRQVNGSRKVAVWLRGRLLTNQRLMRPDQDSLGKTSRSTQPTVNNDGIDKMSMCE